ncbi:radical SAM protein [bacterium]|nr:radical SAM protein [bacterium]
MKVLLIQPPDTHMITTNVPSVVDEETGAYPPLGILYVAAYLQQNTDVEIEILDCILEKYNYDQVEDAIRRSQPNIVGITATTFTLIDCILTAKTIKKIDPAIRVILGGPHVYIYPQETMQIAEVDHILIGEGEQNFAQLVNAIAHEEDIASIRGIGYRDHGEIQVTPILPLNQHLDELPFPARHLIPQERYYTVLAKKTPITTMMTSRGCPYKCIFCDRPHLGKQFRFRGPESVVNEMQQCEEMGIGEIFVYDDTFTVDRQRVLDICRMKIERGLRIGWDIRAHINTMNDEMLDELAAAGCLRIHFGVESGNQEINKAIRKGLNLEKTKEMFKKTRQRGMDTLGYFMIGNPDETREQVLETIEYARNLDADYIHLSVATPFPATDLYRLGFERGLYQTDYWREFAKNPTPDFTPALWEENLTRDELIDLMQWGYKRFYMRGDYLLKKVLSIRSWSEFKRKAKAGSRLLYWGSRKKSVAS